MKPFLKITTAERAEEDDFREALAQTLEEKLDILQRLREIVHDLTHQSKDPFRRVVLIRRLDTKP